MADIELVIKIDEGIAQGIIEGKNDIPRNIVRSFQATIADAIKNGTLLPKGHGKIIDESEITEVYFTQIEGKIINGMKMSNRNMVTGTNAPTIIEAESE